MSGLIMGRLERLEARLAFERERADLLAAALRETNARLERALDQFDGIRRDVDVAARALVETVMAKLEAKALEIDPLADQCARQLAMFERRCVKAMERLDVIEIETLAQRDERDVISGSPPMLELGGES